MKKAFIFLSNGFEDVEAVTPIDYLRRVGIDLVTVGVPGKTITSSKKMPVICDIVLDDALKMADDCFMAILPGGMQNSQTLGNTEGVRNIVEKTLENGGLVGAICAAPVLVLGKWGLLKNKKYTCYPGMGGNLSTKPQITERVVRDGNIITSAGAGAAEEFAFALVEASSGKTALNKLKEEVVAR